MPAALTVETERLILRAWRDEDIEPWVTMNADPRVMEFFPGTYDRKTSVSMAALLRAELEERGYGWWVLEPKGGPAFAGIIAVQDVPFDAPFAPAIEVGWRLAFDAWGKGYATEGAAAAIAYAFNRLNCDEIVAMTSVLNQRSQRVMQRLGMTRDYAADFEHPRLPQGHRLRSHVLYRIVRPSERT